MKENLEKRKEDLLNILAEQYKNKPGKWWHGTTTDYIPTSEAALKSKILKANEPVLLIKSNLLYYYSVTAFFLFCTIVITFVSWGSKTQGSSILIAILCFCAVIFCASKIISARSRIIISPEGIWVDTNDVFIPWGNITASFIERVNGDGEELYLILHYFEPASDEFKKIVYWLNNVGIEYRDLSFYIEYWKFVTEKNKLK